MITITILWGAELFPDDGNDKTYTFDTKAEAEAFLYGIDEAMGWLDYEVITDEHV